MDKGETLLKFTTKRCSFRFQLRHKFSALHTRTWGRLDWRRGRGRVGHSM